jgi:hypothetical protein
MNKNLLLVIFLLFIFQETKSQIFFSEDFASGIPLGWNNVDASGNNILWRRTTSGAQNGGTLMDSVLNPTGTTAPNGYLIIDSDSAGQSATEDSYLTTSAINCTGHMFVHLSFNEYFAQYLASTGTVSVSNDNVTWTDVHLAHDSLGTNQGTPNPNLIDVDITSVAANQATVYIRFYYHGEWDYWWFVDDVNLFEPPPTDLAVMHLDKLNSEYTLIPFGQATTLDMDVTISNIGSSTAIGGTALFEIINTTTTQTVFSENMNLASIASGSSQTLSPSAAFTPASAGTYKSQITVSIAGDATSGNNFLESDPISLSDTVYARDDGNFAGTQGIGVGPAEEPAFGQNFKVNVTGNLSSITFFMDDGFGAQPAGTPVYFTIHPQMDNNTPPDANTVLATSDTILFTPGMIPASGAYYTVNIHGGLVQLQPGLYFISMHETDSILTIGYSNSIYSPGAVWAHWVSIPSPPAVNGWAKAEDFTNQIAYMIRANFGGGPTGIFNPDASVSFSVYPNPAKKYLYLSRNNGSDKESVFVSVSNITGQEVFKGEWEDSNRYSIDVEKFTRGLYSVVLYSADTYVSKLVLVID